MTVSNIWIFFFFDAYILLPDLRLAEFSDAKLWIRRTDCKVMCGFLTPQGLSPNPLTVQRSIVPTVHLALHQVLPTQACCKGKYGISLCE